MSEDLLRWVEIGSEAWEQGHCILAKVLNEEVLHQCDLEIKARPPHPRATLDRAYKLLTKALDRLLPYLPEERYGCPWIVGRDAEGQAIPLLELGSANLDDQLQFFLGLYRDYLRDQDSRKWFQDNVVTPIVDHAKDWRARFDALWQQFSKDEPGTTRKTPLKPFWEKDCCRLWLGDDVVKNVRSRSVAKNVVRILDKFQEEGWPSRIDDPLGHHKNQQRLHEAIRSLNSGLHAMHFRGDGSGQGIIYELT